MRFNPSRFKKTVLITVLFCSFFVFASPAKAVAAAPMFELGSLPTAFQTAKDAAAAASKTIWEKLLVALKKAGSSALQSTVRSALNKFAYDTATYLGSGGKGQQPLFVTKSWGSYLKQIGDEAAGQFIENFADSFASDVQADQARERGEENCSNQFDKCYNKCSSMPNGPEYDKCNTECNKKLITCRNNNYTNYTNALANNSKAAANGTKTSSLNLCNPSVEVRMKLALGLVNQQRPTRPNCSWSELSNNWVTAYKNVSETNIYSKLRNMFDIQSTDLSAALALHTGLMEEVSLKTETSKTNLIGKGGWLDTYNIGEKLVGLPDQAKVKTELAQQGYISNMGTFTGDALIDAGNVFLNQLAMSAFNNWMSGLSGGVSSGGTYGGSNSSIYSYESGSSSSADYFKNKLSLMSILKPQFAEKANYNVLAEMAICPDAKNPGPNNCVIDNRFMEAISTQKTIGEALTDGSLNGSWLMTTNNTANSYQENYSLRNAIILRKFRILPIGWEAAIEKAAANGKNATLADIVSCFSPDDNYRTFSSPEIESNQTWCRDLIDPKWVLKAPQSYCAKSGFGNQIISSQIIETGETGTTTPATELIITRQDDYCADEKTCIKENSKGVCEAYGYCTEDRRTWNFGNDSCEPIFNSCETFADTNGNTISYLKNTLDYGSCTKDNSGCRQYSTFGSYASSTNQISWSGNNAYAIFLNSKAESCSSASESCQMMTRVKPSWGDNLIFNNNFALDTVGTSTTNGILSNHWKASGTIEVVSEADSNNKLLKFDGNQAGLISDSSFSVIPSGITPIADYYYTLSAEVFFASDEIVTMKLGGTDSVSTSTKGSDNWQTISLTAKPSHSISSLDFSILINNGTFYLRNLKLEANNHFSGWSDYGAVTTQEKLIPSYLASLCYVNPFATGMYDYRLKNNAPEICKNFARRCNKDEVGCQNFASVDGFSLTGKVSFDEYCPQECVNYDSYVQQKTNFQSVSANYFIPNTATACSASAVGCSRFTNLDDVAQGGETNEYYSALRRCIQPDNTCGAFYSWSGENESGYQLVAYNLVANGNQPKVSSDDSAECNKDIFELSPADPDYNPDCRQFYDKNGAVSYHLYSRTITCSTDCRRVRLDESTNKDECIANGGIFTNNICIFQALPSQSTTCAPQENGCREYNGNNGNNVRIVSSYDFEDGNPVFSGNNSISKVSTNKNGKSLAFEGEIAVAMEDLVKQNAAYSLKFLAKATSQGNELKTYFLDAKGKKVYFDSGTEEDSIVINDTEWRVYQISLPVLNHRVESGEKLVFESDDKMFIDSIVLTEITDRYYLIKDSWTTPDICYYDLNDEYRGPEYNLGCSAYTDPNGTNHNLRQFGALCDSSSAGCEAIIDTQNSNNPYAQSFADNTVNVSADKMIYAIFDRSKQCSVDNIGCSRLGKGEKSGSTTIFSDAYIKNNPNKYDSTICKSENVGCETFYGASGGTSYFRNPLNDACQYRASQTTTNKTWGWFKLPVKRCDANNDGQISGTELGTAVCGDDSNCGGKKCILDSSDYPCDVSYFKTIGSSSAGTPQPSKNVGLCEAASSGCSEYIDASSEVSPNLVANPTFSDLDKNGTVGDLWTNNSQNIYLSARKLYVARSDGDITNTLSCENYGGPIINVLGSDNNISTISVSWINVTKDGTYFILKYPSSCRLSNNLVNGARAKTVSVREALVAYQLEGNMDTKTCGSRVNFDDGCVLFNNRANNGSQGAISKLAYNVFTSPNLGGTADACSGGNCNANVVVKVTPNRVCSRWLACTTKIKNEKTGEDYCYSLGECDKLAENGDCDNFVATATNTHTFSYANDKNATGYQLLNSFYVANMQEVGNRSGSLMSPINFEDGGGTFNLSATFEGKTANYGKSLTDAYTLIQEPRSGSDKKKFSVSYPAEGKNFIGVDAKKMVGVERVSINPNSDYFINYLVNTDELTPGATAMVRVLDTENKSVLAEFTDKTNGWQRIVHRINVPNNSVTIMFGVKQSDGVSGKVYYDDIKMEPVLKINNTGVDSKDYLAKECRLYPGEDNLTCTSNSENVIKSGLEGYCLKHDPINPGVCLQWLPIDNIASASVSEKNAGYKGAYPLYYCAEANANFDLVEKRQAYRLASVITSNGCNWTNNPQNGFMSGRSFGDGHSCDEGYRAFYYEYYVNGDLEDNSKNDKDGCNGEYICIPDSGQGMKVVVHLYDDDGGVDGSIGIEYLNGVTLNYGSKYITFDSEKRNYEYVISDTKPVIDDSFTNDKKLIASSQSPVPGYSYFGGDHGHTFARFNVNSSGWYKFVNGINNAEKSAAPFVRVYDHNNKPTTEDGLKYLNVDSSNPEKTFYPTCNKFVQVLDANGNGMPWVERLVKNPTATKTPEFFPDLTDFGFNYSLTDKLFGLFYGDLYGPANLKGINLLSSAAVQFFTNNTDANDDSDAPYAGRPYGCQDGGKGSCQYLGYCENNPMVTCLTISGNGNSGTCGDDGRCISYGYKSEEQIYNNANQKNTLKNIFLKAIGGFNFKDGKYEATGLEGVSYDGTSGSYSIKQCLSRPADNKDFDPDSDFCAIYPKINNVYLYRGNGTGPALTPINLANGEWNIGPGYYTLKFNSFIDPEQQPMKELRIDWGDGNMDIISNQDNHPSTPHVISHNYGYTSGVNATSKKIKIKVTDNWDFFGVFPLGASFK